MFSEEDDFFYFFKKIKLIFFLENLIMNFKSSKIEKSSNIEKSSKIEKSALKCYTVQVREQYECYMAVGTGDGGGGDYAHHIITPPSPTFRPSHIPSVLAFMATWLITYSICVLEQ